MGFVVTVLLKVEFHEFQLPWQDVKGKMAVAAVNADSDKDQEASVKRPKVAKQGTKK